MEGIVNPIYYDQFLDLKSQYFLPSLYFSKSIDYCSHNFKLLWTRFAPCVNQTNSYFNCLNEYLLSFPVIFLDSIGVFFTRPKSGFGLRLVEPTPRRDFPCPLCLIPIPKKTPLCFSVNSLIANWIV